MTQIVSYLTKGEMLDIIKEHLNMQKNTEFARFLGVSSQAVSNWYARNTFDAELLYTKCDFINADWLLTGRGSMLREEQPYIQVTPSIQPADDSFIYTMYKEERAKSDALIKEIGALEQQVKTLEEKILGLQHEIVALTSDNGDAQDVTIAGVG